MLDYVRIINFYYYYYIIIRTQTSVVVTMRRFKTKTRKFKTKDKLVSSRPTPTRPTGSSTTAEIACSADDVDSKY